MLYRAHTVPPALPRIFKWCCLRLSMHVLYSGSAQTLCMRLQWEVAVNVLLYTWKTLKHTERSQNPKKKNFFPGKRGVPLMCGNLTATNSTSFCVLLFFYIFLYSCESLLFEGLLQHDMSQLLHFHNVDAQGNIFHWSDLSPPHPLSFLCNALAGSVRKSRLAAALSGVFGIKISDNFSCCSIHLTYKANQYLAFGI